MNTHFGVKCSPRMERIYSFIQKYTQLHSFSTDETVLNLLPELQIAMNELVFQRENLRMNKSKNNYLLVYLNQMIADLKAIMSRRPSKRITSTKLIKKTVPADYLPEVENKYIEYKHAEIDLERYEEIKKNKIVIENKKVSLLEID